jgi:hypothetical protein
MVFALDLIADMSTTVGALQNSQFDRSIGGPPKDDVARVVWNIVGGWWLFVASQSAAASSALFSSALATIALAWLPLIWAIGIPLILCCCRGSTDRDHQQPIKDCTGKKVPGLFFLDVA